MGRDVKSALVELRDYFSAMRRGEINLEKSLAYDHAAKMCESSIGDIGEAPFDDGPLLVQIGKLSRELIAALNSASSWEQLYSEEKLEHQATLSKRDADRRDTEDMAENLRQARSELERRNFEIGRLGRIVAQYESNAESAQGSPMQRLNDLEQRVAHIEKMFTVHVNARVEPAPGSQSRGQMRAETMADESRRTR